MISRIINPFSKVPRVGLKLIYQKSIRTLFPSNLKRQKVSCKIKILIHHTPIHPHAHTLPATLNKKEKTKTIELHLCRNYSLGITYQVKKRRCVADQGSEMLLVYWIRWSRRWFYPLWWKSYFLWFCFFRISFKIWNIHKIFQIQFVAGFLLIF